MNRRPRFFLTVVIAVIGAGIIAYIALGSDAGDRQLQDAKKETARNKARAARQPAKARALRERYREALTLDAVRAPRKRPPISDGNDHPEEDDRRRLDDESRFGFTSPTAHEAGKALSLTRDPFAVVVADCWHEHGEEHGRGFVELEAELFSSPDEGMWIQSVVQDPDRDEDWARALVDNICSDETATDVCEHLRERPVVVFPDDHPVSVCLREGVEGLVFEPLDESERIFIRQGLNHYWSEKSLENSHGPFL